jgi:hypothetical protein
MTIIAALFLLYDIINHGLLFAGSSLPFALTVICLQLLRLAEIKLRADAAASSEDAPNDRGYLSVH